MRSRYRKSEQRQLQRLPHRVLVQHSAPRRHAVVHRVAAPSSESDVTVVTLHRHTGW